MEGEASSGKIKFVCLAGIGQTRFEYLTSEEIADVAAEWSGGRV